MPTHKNALFLIADDWSRLASCYGNSVVMTPRIDAFARGRRFDHAFCTLLVRRQLRLHTTGHHSHTHGQHGHCHGIHGFRTGETMTSTPQALRAASLATTSRVSSSRNALIDPLNLSRRPPQPRVGCRATPSTTMPIVLLPTRRLFRSTSSGTRLCQRQGVARRV